MLLSLLAIAIAFEGLTCWASPLGFAQYPWRDCDIVTKSGFGRRTVLTGGDFRLDVLFWPVQCTLGSSSVVKVSRERRFLAIDVSSLFCSLLVRHLF